MLKAYATPGLTVHGSIAMLTLQEEGGSCEGKKHAGEEHKGGGESKPDRPEYDAFCLFSHS